MGGIARRCGEILSLLGEPSPGPGGAPGSLGSPPTIRNMSSTEDDPRLSKLSDICLRFPETTRTDSGRHASFLVRKKTFAWFLDDHHGDGIVSVCCKMGLGENEEIVSADPKRFYLPAYMAHRGWVREVWIRHRDDL